MSMPARMLVGVSWLLVVKIQAWKHHWLSSQHLPSSSCQVREVQHRIHELVGIPERFGESLYVLQYAQGQAGRRGGLLGPAT